MGVIGLCLATFSWATPDAMFTATCQQVMAAALEDRRLLTDVLVASKRTFYTTKPHIASAADHSHANITALVHSEATSREQRAETPQSTQNPPSAHPPLPPRFIYITLSYLRDSIQPQRRTEAQVA